MTNQLRLLGNNIFPVIFINNRVDQILIKHGKIAVTTVQIEEKTMGAHLSLPIAMLHQF